MPPALNIGHAKILFSVMIGSVLVPMAYLHYLNGQHGGCLLSACLALVAFINALALGVGRAPFPAKGIVWLFMLFVGGLSLLTAAQAPEHNLYWLYLYSIGALFLLPLKKALWLLAGYTPLAAYIVVNVAPPLLQPQVLFTLVVIATVAIFLGVVKSRTHTLLEPLISKDLTTGAHKETFLHQNLNTEINRAEREGTALTLMCFRLQTSHDTPKYAPLKSLPVLAAAIDGMLRPFDQYYRLQEDGFAVILPHTTTAEAISKADHLLTNNAYAQHKKYIQLGVASLNVGDDAASLILSAQQDCRHA